MIADINVIRFLSLFPYFYFLFYFHQLLKNSALQWQNFGLAENFSQTSSDTNENYGDKIIILR